MAYLMNALRYFDVSVFLEAVWSHLGDTFIEIIFCTHHFPSIYSDLLFIFTHCFKLLKLQLNRQQHNHSTKMEIYGN